MDILVAAFLPFPTVPDLPPVLELVFGVVTAASAVTAMTATPKDDRILGKIYRLLDILALNIGRAKDRAEEN